MPHTTTILPFSHHSSYTSLLSVTSGSSSATPIQLKLWDVFNYTTPSAIFAHESSYLNKYNDHMRKLLYSKMKELKCNADALSKKLFLLQ